MRYLSFRIRNFKGINDASIQLDPRGAGVFTLVGLNESGKTSVLEAINLFRPDDEYNRLTNLAEISASTAAGFIPKKLQANFSDAIRISGTVQLDQADLIEISGIVGKKHKGILDINSIPNPITLSKTIHYEDSEYQRDNFTLSMVPSFRPTGAKKNREYPYPSDIWSSIANAIIAKLPIILYFPTFIFSMPSRITLNPNLPEDTTNAVYRRILEDVASSLPNKIDIQKHIVERMTGKPPAAAKTASGLVVLGNARQAQAHAALNDMSVHISATVFKEWEKVLGASVKGREISLQPGIEVYPDKPAEVFVQFMMKEGSHYYDISERSLGFRWFFSFLLFTVYRSLGDKGGNALFLLDEPASNLHPKAQAQLLSSFPMIASKSSALVYSTHSHYMIKPAWLEQTSIVSNAAIERAEKTENKAAIGSNPTDVTVTRYRRFVGERPDKWTYFQPILDQLDYTLSELDPRRPSLLVEGKGDYAVLEYVRRIILEDSSAPAIVPTRGATGMDDLIGLFLGWGIPFCVCLDDDKEGISARKRYRGEWGLPEKSVFTYGDVDRSMLTFRLEEVVPNEDVIMIQTLMGLTAPPTKDQRRLFFAEKLASEEVVPVSVLLRDRVASVLAKARDALEI